MLFRRRIPQDFWAKLRTAAWPSSSFGRSAQYFQKRVLRLPGSPHAIALGVAIGVAVAFTPFFGFHTVIAIGFAFLLGGNLVAAALGSAVANPLTVGFILASTYKLGHIILGGPRFRSVDVPTNLAAKSLHAVWPALKQMIVGAVPLGLLAGLIAYLIVVFATNAFQTMRRERLAARRRARAAVPSAPSMMEKA